MKQRLENAANRKFRTPSRFFKCNRIQSMHSVRKVHKKYLTLGVRIKFITLSKYSTVLAIKTNIV